MPNTNFAVGIVKYACPICGRDAEENLIMNRILSKKTADEINKVHLKTVGYSKNACSECAKYKDQVVFIVEVDGSKSTKAEPYRTGRIFGINKNCSLFTEAANYIITTDNGVRYMFADISACKSFGLHEAVE